MGKWLQRIRGALGIGLTWAAGWAPIGALVGGVLHVVLPGTPTGLGAVIALNATTFAALGFVGGAVFSGILRLTEGNHRFDQLSVPRFALWGTVGGLLLGGIAVSIGLWGAGFSLVGAGMVGASASLGAASAAGSLTLARASDDQELLEAGEGVSDAALTQQERSELLGSGG